MSNGELESVSCVPSAPCVAVGYFVSTSGVDRPLIEIRRGRRWSIETSPALPGAGNMRLSAVVCPAKRNCVAVGFSVLASGATVPLAERWNGSSWSIQRTIDAVGVGSQLTALSCSSATSCVAVGSGPHGGLIERWNGGRWSPQRAAGVGADRAAQLDGVSCTSQAVCVAVGSTGRGALAELWNGRRWSRLPGPRGAGVLTAVSCTSPQACSAIGEINAVYAVQRWDGARWTQENVPARACAAGAAICSNVLSAITCVSSSLCYLAGAFDFGAGGSSGLDTTAPIAASWHGSRWRNEPVTHIGVCPTSNTVVCGTSLNAISCATPSACVAVGSYSNAAGAGQPLIERRNPGKWSVQRAPSPLGPASSQLNAVSCSSSTACTAVGSYTNASGTFVPLAERWNGVTWTIQPTPATGEFGGVSCTAATACTAVGAQGFTTFPATGAGLAETWDGATWTAAQTPGAGTLGAVSCTSARACVAIGVTPTGAALTESWNGATWTIRPSPADGPLSAIACVSNEACLGVGQDGAGDIVADSWDGTSWAALPPVTQSQALTPQPPAISCSAANACTVVDNLVTETGLVYRWDGSGWSLQQLQLPAREYVSALSGVACPSAISCTAVGTNIISKPNGLTNGPLLERWDGTAWSVQPPPGPFQTEGSLQAVSCASTTTCVAVGVRAVWLPDGHIQTRFKGSGLPETVPYVLSDS